MNIDLFASTVFGDAQGLASFFLAHRFIHDATAKALTAQFGSAASTFGLSSGTAERAWAELMQGEAGTPPPDALKDWLKYHADIHSESYTLIAGTGTVAPDLSLADFSQEQGFADWMFVHQQMHDFEYQQLGLT
jgi:hypothetical protein